MAGGAASRVRAALGLAVLGLALAASPGEAATAVSDEAVQAVASQLRCVVCQNLSVADSPSEMARQMRELVREQLGQGRTPQEVRAYFVDRYGEWVLLVPRPHGLNLVLWVAPFGALLVGLGVVAVSVRRWSRRPAVPSPGSEAALGPEDRTRIQAELDRLRD